MSESIHARVVVIGGGPGGYAAAFKAADLGLEVTLIDEGENPGGVCLYRGCIPSKALLHAAKLINETHEAGEMGITFTEPEIDLTRMRAWKESVVKRLTGGLGQLTKARNIRYLRGTAAFTDSTTLAVDLVDGEEQIVTFDNAIIAAGSSATRIPGLWIDSPRMIDSTGALEIPDIPGSMLVIGGGYIGLEMGTVYASLGTRVSVVEMLSGILPGADRDLADVLKKRLDKLFHEIMLETSVTGLKETDDGIEVTFEGENVTEKTQLFDKVLMCVGRKPNSANLGLDKASVQVGMRGFITTDQQCRTNIPHIFAIGDIAGEPMLAHKASHEGMVAAEAIAGEKVAFEPHAIPGVVFTDPELAWCGLTEAEAARRDMEVKVVRFPWAASGRATTLARNDGITKLLIDPRTERILGVGICGYGAGEMISEGVLAVEMAALASDLKLSIHPHPTLSETVMEAAESFYGSSTHLYRPPKKSGKG